MVAKKKKKADAGADLGERIFRDDFAVTPKGWDPEAVQAHLESVAEEVATIRSQPSSETVSEGVRKVLAAADLAAADLTERSERALTDAKAKAEATLDQANREAKATKEDARAEAGSMLSRAHREAGSKVAAAREQAESVVAASRDEAEEIRAGAHAEAEKARAAAESESQRILSKAKGVRASARKDGERAIASARAEARALIEESEEAVAGLIAHATHLGDRVTRFGQELTKGFENGKVVGKGADEAVENAIASPLDELADQAPRGRFRRPAPAAVGSGGDPAGVPEPTASTATPAD